MTPAERAALIAQGPLVLYDGVCGLCNFTVRFLAPRDRTGLLHFAPIQSAAGQEVLCRHGLPLTGWNSFVFLEAGQVHLKSSACLQIIAYLRGAWLVLSVLRIVPRGVSDWFYDRIALNRYAFLGRHEACLIPTGALQAKLLI